MCDGVSGFWVDQPLELAVYLWLGCLSLMRAASPPNWVFLAEFHLSPSFQPRTFHNSLKEADPFLSAPFRSVFSTLCNLARGPKSLLLCSALRGVAGSLTLDPVLAGLEDRLRGLGLQTGRLSSPARRQ